MRKCVLLIILLVAFLMPCMVIADLLVYEGFEYTAGETLAAKSGGTGWSGSWNTNPHVIAADSLDMSNLMFSTRGGSVYTLANSSTANRNFPGIDLSQDGTYYISYICQRTGWTEATSGEYGDVHLRTSSWGRVATWSNTSREEFATDNIGTTMKSLGADTTEVLFFVGKIEANAVGDDKIFLKVYRETDQISTVEPLAWTVTGGVEDSIEIASMFTIWAGGNAGYKFAIDEIRIATEWADAVAPAKANRVVYLSPSLNSENISPVTFNWQAPTEIDSPTYNLYYSSVLGEVDPNDVVADVSPVALTDASYSSVSLDSPVTYYWRVDTVDDGDVLVGDISSFSTIVPISPISPVNEEIGTARNLTLSWESLLPYNGDYEVNMGDSSEILNYVGMSTGEDYVPSNLEWGQTYYWQVSYNDGVDVIASTVWSFTVAAGAECDGTLVGDFDGNCITNLADFATMAKEWMNCTAINSDDCN